MGVHVAVSVKGVGWNDPDSVPLMVMQHMLGSMDKDSYVGINSGSKLQQRLAANSLCDHFMTFNTHYTDTGIFGMYAVSDAEKMDDLCWTMMHDMTALAYSVTDIEVARAKNQLKSSLLLSGMAQAGSLRRWAGRSSPTAAISTRKRCTLGLMRWTWTQ